MRQAPRGAARTRFPPPVRAARARRPCSAAHTRGPCPPAVFRRPHPRLVPAFSRHSSLAYWYLSASTGSRRAARLAG